MSAKAKHHHTKLGECLDSGDHAGAMHHAGHIMSALKHSQRNAALSESRPSGEFAMATAGDEEEETPPAKSSLRSRLKGMKKA